jgi:hypothetical protein
MRAAASSICPREISDLRPRRDGAPGLFMAVVSPKKNSQVEQETYLNQQNFSN